MDASWTSIIQSAAGGAVGTAVLAAVFNRVSGINRIELNAGNIRQTALTKQSIDDVFASNTSLGSIVFADTASAYVVVRDDAGTVRNRSFALHIPEQNAQFEQAKKMLTSPLSMVARRAEDIFPEVSQSCRRAARRAEQSWSRPWPLHGLLKLGPDFQKRSRDVSEALLATVTALAKDSSSTDSIMPGSCHLAALWTDETGKRHIVVLPADASEERVLRQRLELGASSSDFLGAKATVSAIAGLRRSQ